MNLTAGDGYGVDLKLTDLRGILQYVPQFREKTFILAVDASIVRDESFANILLDIALLRSLNIRVVLIHGAAELIKALAERENVQASNLDGTGVTDAPTLELPSLRTRWGSYRVSTTFLPGRSNASIRNFFKLC